MGDIQKFFVFTRGRTGSTAIVDEIDKHSDVTCWQELFIDLSSNSILAECYRKHGTQFDKYDIKKEWRPTYDLWLKQYKNIKNLYFYRHLPVNKRFTVKRYLGYIENLEIERGRKAVGFKLLEHQGEKAPGLLDILKQRGYKAIYLERTNLVRLVLSGIIAEKRKRYNVKNYRHTGDAHFIDLDEFEKRMGYQEYLINRQKGLLDSKGYDTLYITYEDFMDNREILYREIFSFLGVDFQLPESTDYSIMIPEISDVVENYEELLARVKQMGYAEMLRETA